MEPNLARLRITCPDQPGIVAAVTGFLASHNANITALDQHATDAQGGTFFMRLEFATPYLDVSRQALEGAFSKVVAERFAMDWDMSYAADPKRVSILVSQDDHCLLELLWRWTRGELACAVAQVISNHPQHREAVERFGIPYHYVPVAPGGREEAEERILGLLEGGDDLVVLARYMQILSPAAVARYPERIINIHHSFLPAFVGANPYQQAYDKGVKLIGATAHFVTEELDRGPIIEQDVARVDHRHSVPELRLLGRDLERQVLARAVRASLEDRIIVFGNKTVVF